MKNIIPSFCLCLCFLVSTTASASMVKDTFNISEPGSLALFSLGIAGLLISRKKIKNT